MEKHEIESSIEHSLRPLKEKFNKIDGFNVRLTKLEEIRGIAVSVAIIFGIIGVSFGTILTSFNTRIDVTNSRIGKTETEQKRITGLVNSLEDKARELEESIVAHQEDIKNYREEQTVIFGRDLSQRVNAAIKDFDAQTDGNLKEKIENLTFRRLQVNSLSVVGKEGEKVVKLSSWKNGGSLRLYNKDGDLSFRVYSTKLDAVVTIYSVVGDKEIVEIRGTLDDDDAINGSIINLYNADGDIGFSANVVGPSGSVEVFSTSTKKEIAALSGTSDGGGLWLYSEEGFNGIAAAVTKIGGVIEFFSTETKKRIAALGISTEHDGSLRLFDKNEKLIFRK